MKIKVPGLNTVYMEFMLIQSQNLKEDKILTK